MQCTEKWNSWCSKVCDWNVGILLIRIAVGVTFILSGWMKVSNMAGTVEFFGKIGINPFWTYVASYVELIGGVVVLLGVFIIPASLLLAIVMVVASVMLYPAIDKMMYPMFVGVTLLALSTFGAGKYAIAKRKCNCGTCDACKADMK